MASEALSDLFAHSLMPPNCRLFNLNRRPLGRYNTSSSVGVEGVGADGRKNKKGTGTTKGGGLESLSPRTLLLWRYEDTMKRTYYLYVDRNLCRIPCGGGGGGRSGAGPNPGIGGGGGLL